MKNVTIKYTSLNFQYSYKCILAITKYDSSRFFKKDNLVFSYQVNLMLLSVFAVISIKICILVDKSLFKGI